MEPKYQYIVIVGSMFGNKTVHGPFYGSTRAGAHDRAVCWVNDEKNMVDDQPYEIEIVELLPA